IIESWINDRSTSGTRGTMISIYVAINYLATAAGQLLITLGDASSFVLFSLASILISAAVMPLSLSRAPAPEPPKLVRVRPWRLFSLSPSGAMAILLIGLSNGALWALGPVFAVAKSNDLASAAQFMSIVVLGGALAQWPIGRISDRFDRRHVLLAVTLAATIAGVAVAFLPQVGGPWLIFALVFGATVLPSYAVASAHVFDLADRSEYVEVSAGILLLFGVGSTLGPIFASLGMNWLGASAMAGFIALAQVTIFSFVLARIWLNKQQMVTGKQPFDLGTAAPMAPAGLEISQRKLLCPNRIA
ncbi:MAG TPA: MFS transporter, partial [Devosia sp.]